MFADVTSQIKPCIYEWCQGFVFDQCPQSGRILLNSSGNITTGLNSNYGNNWYCKWTIVQSNASWVSIKFQEFVTEGPAAGTVGDRVYIWECTDINCSVPNLLGQFAGTAAVIPTELTSTTGILMVQFFSDMTWNFQGFLASFYTPCPPSSFGPGVPDCRPCRTECPFGKSLIGACGAHGSSEDSTCACPPGQHAESTDSPCLQCPSSCHEGVRTSLEAHHFSRVKGDKIVPAGFLPSDYHPCLNGSVCTATVGGRSISAAVEALTDFGFLDLPAG